jgi:hypothetical protein
MHPRVLIIGTVPYNRQTSSRAFESYFSNWEKENLIQIYSNPKEPVHGHCCEFYQITDIRMLKRRFSKKVQTGKLYHDFELKDAWESTPTNLTSSFISKIYGIGSKKSPLNHLLRGWLWKKKYWCTDELNSWVDAFQPECIFLAFSDDYFIPQIALYFAKKYDIPIISCIGDDYYFNEKKTLSPFYYLYKKTYKNLIDKIFQHGGSAAYIGNKIRDKYNEKFHLNGKTVYLTSEIHRREFRPINVENPYITYCGNIRLGRNHSLCTIANTLGKINNSYRVDIYSNETEAEYYDVLKKNKYIRFHGKVPYSDVVSIFKKSDIVLVVEGFDKKDVDITRYSLSTKVADSLASGCAIVSFGSIECGAIEYLKDIDCGPVCTDEKELLETLNLLLNDVNYQHRNYEKSKIITMRNHTLSNSNRVFESIVNHAIAEYRSNDKK